MKMNARLHLMQLQNAARQVKAISWNLQLKLQQQGQVWEKYLMHVKK